MQAQQEENWSGRTADSIGAAGENWSAWWCSIIPCPATVRLVRLGPATNAVGKPARRNIENHGERLTVIDAWSTAASFYEGYGIHGQPSLTRQLSHAEAGRIARQAQPRAHSVVALRRVALPGFGLGHCGWRVVARNFLPKGLVTVRTKGKPARGNAERHGQLLYRGDQRHLALILDEPEAGSRQLISS